MNNPRTTTTSNGLHRHGAPANGKVRFTPPNFANIFNYIQNNTPRTGGIQASACPERNTPAGQALVAFYPYEPPRVEVVTVACEAGYMASVAPGVGGWDDEVDLGGGEMTP